MAQLGSVAFGDLKPVFKSGHQAAKPRRNQPQLFLTLPLGGRCVPYFQGNTSPLCHPGCKGTLGIRLRKNVKLLCQHQSNSGIATEVPKWGGGQGGGMK